MHALTVTHAGHLKRILRYLKGTASLGIHLFTAPTPTITAYTDAD
jgi:hypothetical protein